MTDEKDQKDEKGSEGAEEKEAAPAPGSGGPAGRSEPGEAKEEDEGIPAHTLPPPADFGLHLQSLQMQAWVHLGKIPDPTTGQTSRNMAWARFFIDMLGMLEEKTKGNLTPDEQRYLDMTLTSLRLTFVEEQKTPD
jgi:hypothetical protein